MHRRLKNVTVSLEEDVARWARLEAARRDTSVSRLLGEILRTEMVRSSEYEAAMRTYLSKSAQVHRRPGQSLPCRDELHDRAGLR